MNSIYALLITEPPWDLSFETTKERF